MLKKFSKKVSNGQLCEFLGFGRNKYLTDLSIESELLIDGSEEFEINGLVADSIKDLDDSSVEDE